MARQRRHFSSILFFSILLLLHICHGEQNLAPRTPASLCDQLIRPLGYSCAEHVVQTEDGFLLAVQRINKGKKFESSPPVFLQHGLFQGADTWFLNPAEQSLGFILADRGFDVWVGSVRGTRWSHGHISLSSTERCFWEWSWQELVEYDLKSMLKLVSSFTNSKVLYVGHSQGTIMGLAAMTRPEIVDMIDRAALLAPISYLGHISSKLILRAVGMHLDQVLMTIGVHEVNFRNELGVRIMDMLCDGLVECGNFLSSITGKNCCFNESRVDYYLEYEPHPSSARNIHHLFQMIRTGEFSMYDYGWRGNMNRYGQPRPPSYDLSSIPPSLPLFFAYGGNDALADVADIHRLILSLRSRPESIFLPSYGHLDFLYSVNAPIDFFDHVVQFFGSGPDATF